MTGDGEDWVTGQMELAVAIAYFTSGDGFDFESKEFLSLGTSMSSKLIVAFWFRTDDCGEIGGSPGVVNNCGGNASLRPCDFL